MTSLRRHVAKLNLDCSGKQPWDVCSPLRGSSMVSIQAGDLLLLLSLKKLMVLKWMMWALFRLKIDSSSLLNMDGWIYLLEGHFSFRLVVDFREFYKKFLPDPDRLPCPQASASRIGIEECLRQSWISSMVLDLWAWPEWRCSQIRPVQSCLLENSITICGLTSMRSKCVLSYQLRQNQFL